MSLEKYLDNDRLQFINAFYKFARNLTDVTFCYNDVFGDDAKAFIGGFSRGEIKSMQNGIRKESLSKDDDDFETKTMAKLFFVLESHGYFNLAKDFALVYERMKVKERAQEIVYKEIADCAAFKKRSEAASGPRHHLHDEIVAIMKATWKKEPAFSKTKMIAKLSRRYEGRVDDKTIKDWIKKEKLAPPPPHDRKYKNTELVIPPEYA
ncbi:hypothetical protein HUK76_16200 [Citrobacter portucalensis]|uniref:hypothetical protein n=1 Tax=Citrobacter portucalensis TaxID=1639133 RepID=UPI0015801F58|nr:hypothetical protein [Citrobacter portucalensis]NUH55210.1 hypothetical protein [Citrobacter portucalensis]